MHPSPLNTYRSLLTEGRFQPDSAQEKAVEALDHLWQQLRRSNRSSFLARLRRRKAETVQGLYLGGGVGRGKTWLMDLFYDTLPGVAKQRVHFHRFMARVHDELGARGSTRDPLPEIARQWAARWRVLCFDVNWNWRSLHGTTTLSVS